MRGTDEHSRITVIMGGPNKSGYDGRGWSASARVLFVLFVFFVVPFQNPAVLAHMTRFSVQA
jgi:hypothetical protein